MAMAVAEWCEAAAAAIAAYTGMAPAAFFTAVAVAAAALYVAVSGLLARPAQAASTRRQEAEEERETEPQQPLPPPVQIGEVTEEELRAYDGSDPKKPLLMAIKGQIYDVTQSRMFYGPGGPYALFAGRDASRALAKMSFESSDLTSDISDLGPFEAEALQEWEYKFKSKYVTVGTIKKTIPVTTVTTERDIDGSILESNHVPELKETGATNQGSVVGKATEMPVVDVETSSHEDIVENAKELLDSDTTNASSQADAGKPDETPNVAAKNSNAEETVETKETPDAVVTNSSSIEKAVEPKETHQLVDGKNICNPEDATEEPNEAADAVGLNTTTSHEDVSSDQDGEEKLKDTSDVEANNV
ncbi:hypothetical protein HU200_039328 [Digitaria exilis]|uniref:Cytochrome b5 heme-binding domain-containing protein n=1 Tax=Digitaria exilis TaxID=1010633 RepID=A0A835BB38_9POAL|nr:hypothetical protein HU200_039328 [Digitaria exilis]CAB3447352.1 unnamed protein product [Digitaria exilis]